MGIFRNDPSPFIGGSQPLDGRRMNSALMGATADAPPLNRKALALVTSILAAWVPPDPSPFMGGRQPLQARTLPPQITAVPVDNPPFTHRSRSAAFVQQAASADPWAYVFLAERGRLQPYGPGNLSPGIPGQSVDSPPPKPAQGISWPQTDLPVVQQRLLSPGIPGQSVDTVLRAPSVPSSVLMSWQALDPLPTLTTKIVQPFIASASVPSVNAANLTVIVQSWQQPDPLQALTRKLPPSVTAVPVNDPPFSTRKAIHWPLWQVLEPLPTLNAKLIQSSVISADNPSGARVPRIVVADSLPLPQAPKKLAAILAPAAQVDNPPFSSRRAIYWPLWQVLDPLPSLGAKLVQPGATDNPPFSTRRVIHWPNWAPPDLLPTLAGKLNPAITAVAADQPSGTAILSVVVVPQPPLPQLSVKMAAILAPAAQVDNPPFGRRQPYVWTLGDGYSFVTAAAAEVPQPVDNPPFGAFYSTLNIVPIWWIPPDPQPTSLGKINPSTTAVAVNNPPFSTRRVIHWPNWAPPDPQPTLSYKLTPSIIDVPVSDPPFTHQGRLQRDLILTAWQPPPPDYVTIKMTVKIVQEGPLPPPATQIEFFPFIANVGTMMRRG